MSPDHPEVQVRAGVEDDLAALTDIYNHYVRETAITFDTRVFTPGERREWLLSHPKDGPYRLLVAQGAEPAPAGSAFAVACPDNGGCIPGGGRILGYATSSPYRARAAYATSVEVSIYLAPDAGGSGVGTLLYEALFAALGGEDLHRAYAAIASKSRPAEGDSRPAAAGAGKTSEQAAGTNEASLRLHRRFGFRHVGTYREVGRKFGTWWDVDWYEKELGDAGQRAADTR